jgi:hypothetical protein
MFFATRKKTEGPRATTFDLYADQDVPSLASDFLLSSSPRLEKMQRHTP